MNKPFSPTLYAENDDAKNLVIDFLKANGFLAKVNPDQYGIDVLAKHLDTNEKYELEVEVKHNWRGERFQYPTLHFPGRKQKFIKNSQQTVFFILNHERTHAYWVDGTVLSKSPIVTKDTIYTKNEQFIEVSLSNCKVIDLNNPLVV
jgi:hypothetical protein